MNRHHEGMMKLSVAANMPIAITANSRIMAPAVLNTLLVIRLSLGQINSEIGCRLVYVAGMLPHSALSRIHA